MMITWVDKIAFVGISVESVTPDLPLRNRPYSVKLSYNPGLCSFGDGETMGKAIEDAAISMPIDWHSVEYRITEREWRQMSHT